MAHFWTAIQRPSHSSPVFGKLLITHIVVGAGVLLSTP